MAQYKSYTDETLRYIEYAFYWINQTKGEFRDVCQIDVMIWGSKNGHFKFAK